MHLGKIQKILITMEEETNFHQTEEGLGLSSCSESDHVSGFIPWSRACQGQSRG